VWENPGDAGAYRDAGVTPFTTEIHPDSDGYDFGVVEQMVSRLRHVNSLENPFVLFISNALFCNRFGTI
jgi:hypothetical protein